MTLTLGRVHPLPQDHPDDEAGADTAGVCVCVGGCEDRFDMYQFHEYTNLLLMQPMPDPVPPVIF